MNKALRQDKRGVSPIYATVLLLAITISLAILVFNTTTLEFGSLTQQVQKEISSSALVNFDIRKVTQTTDTLRILVENQDNKDIEAFNVIITTSSGEFVQRSPQKVKAFETSYIEIPLNTTQEITRVSLLPLTRQQDNLLIHSQSTTSTVKIEYAVVTQDSDNDGCTDDIDYAINESCPQNTCSISNSRLGCTKTCKALTCNPNQICQAGSCVFGEEQIQIRRTLDCPRCGQHKAPPLTNVNMSIEISGQGEVLEEVIPSTWLIQSTNGGTLTQLNQTQNKISWNISGIIDPKVSYIVTSPQKTTPPSTYVFSSVLDLATLDSYDIIVSDPTTTCATCLDCSSQTSTPGNTIELTSDMSIIDGGQCINVVSDNITIDCKGFKIKDPGFFGAKAILIQHKNNITVKNCVSQRIDEGIFIDNSTLVNIIYSNLSADSTVLFVDRSKNITVQNSILNSSTGLTYNTYNIYLTNSNNTEISNTTLITGSNPALYLDNSVNLKFLNNIVNQTEKLNVFTLGLLYIKSSTNTTLNNNTIITNSFSYDVPQIRVIRSNYTYIYNNNLTNARPGFSTNVSMIYIGDSDYASQLQNNPTYTLYTWLENNTLYSGSNRTAIRFGYAKDSILTNTNITIVGARAIALAIENSTNITADNLVLLRHPMTTLSSTVTDTAAHISHSSNISISKSILSNFSFTFFIEQSNHTKVSQNNIKETTTAIYTDASFNVSVNKNIINLNQSTADTAIFIYRGSGSDIFDNKISEIGDTSSDQFIKLSNTQFVLIKNNTLIGNRKINFAAIYSISTTNINITSNIINFTTKGSQNPYLIYITNSLLGPTQSYPDFIEVSNNTIFGTDDSTNAVFLGSSHNALIVNNRIDMVGQLTEPIRLTTLSTNVSIISNNITSNATTTKVIQVDYTTSSPVAKNINISFNNIVSNGTAIVLRNAINSFVSKNNIFVDKGVLSDQYGIVFTSNSSYNVVDSDNITILTSGSAIRFENAAALYNTIKHTFANSTMGNGVEFASGSAKNQIIDSYIHSRKDSPTKYDVISSGNPTVINPTNTLINTTFDKTKVSFTAQTDLTLDVRYYLGIYVNYTNGTKIPGVNITLRDKNDNFVLETFTNPDGYINRTNLTEFTQDIFSKFFPSNYTIYARLNPSSQKSINVSDNIETFITFEEPPAPLINFTYPTPINATITQDTSVQINVSIVESNLSEVRFTWNHTNYTIFDESLLLYYNFDNRSALGENDRFIADISTYSLNASVVGNAINWTPYGRYHGAFDFNGTYIFGIVPDSQNKNHIEANISFIRNFTGNAPITISLWIYRKSDWRAYDGLLDIGGYNNCLLLAGYDIDQRASFYITGAGFDRVKTPILQNNRWYHIVARYDGSNQSIFLDSILSDSRIESQGFTNCATSLWIGGQRAGNEFNGSIDEVMIWNRSLSDDEVKGLYYSTLFKFNKTQWYLNVNQTDLQPGRYTYTAYAKNLQGQKNQTEERTLIVGKILPVIKSVELTDTATYNDCNKTVCSLTPVRNFTVTNMQARVSAYDPEGCSLATHSAKLYLCTLEHNGIDKCTPNIANFSYDLTNLVTDQTGKLCNFTFVTPPQNTPPFYWASRNYTLYVNVTEDGNETRNVYSNSTHRWFYQRLISTALLNSSMDETIQIRLGDTPIELGVFNPGIFEYNISNWGNVEVNLSFNATDPTNIADPTKFWNLTTDPNGFVIDDEAFADYPDVYIPSVNLTYVQQVFGFEGGLRRCSTIGCNNQVNETLSTHYHIRPPLGLEPGTYNSVIILVVTPIE